MRASIAAAAALLLAAGAAAYPIDGNEQTGISRLIAYDLARDGLLARGTLKPGSLLPRVSVRPRLLHRLDLELPPPASLHLQQTGEPCRESFGGFLKTQNPFAASAFPSPWSTERFLEPNL